MFSVSIPNARRGYDLTTQHLQLKEPLLSD
jgi:hypothetical protein